MDPDLRINQMPCVMCHEPGVFPGERVTWPLPKRAGPDTSNRAPDPGFPRKKERSWDRAGSSSSVLYELNVIIYKALLLFCLASSKPRGIENPVSPLRVSYQPPKKAKSVWLGLLARRGSCQTRASPICQRLEAVRFWPLELGGHAGGRRAEGAWDSTSDRAQVGFTSPA